MALKAKKPEIVEKKLKMFLFGPPGSRKTTSAIMFPKSVLIDMERGSENYSKSIEKAGSVVLHTTNPDEVLEEVNSLLTEKHEFLTLILDPVLFFTSQHKKNGLVFLSDIPITKKIKNFKTLVCDIGVELRVIIRPCSVCFCA